MDAKDAPLEDRNWKAELKNYILSFPERHRVPLEYRIVEHPKPPNQLWVVAIFLDNRRAAVGIGKSQLEAEHLAAKRVYNKVIWHTKPEVWWMVYVMKETTLERGAKTEERVIAAAKNVIAARPPWFPNWFLGICSASKEEDEQEGTDAWVNTADLGDLRLQIKSSHACKCEFEREHADLDIAVVAVEYSEGDEEIADAVVAEIEYLRERLARR